MSDHLPECPYSKPCPDEWRNARTIRAEGLPVPHRIVSGSSGRCVECGAGDCICDELRACEQRILDAAREAVAADMSAAINVCGECTDVALAAIDTINPPSLPPTTGRAHKY